MVLLVNMTIVLREMCFDSAATLHSMHMGNIGAAQERTFVLSGPPSFLRRWQCSEQKIYKEFMIVNFP